MADSPAVLTIVSPRRGLIILLVICTLFTAMGVVVLALAPTKTLNLVVGIAAVGFFGVGGGVSLIGQWRRSTLLRADDAGIRLGSGGHIPWDDLDRVGTSSAGLGIRLRRYDTFLSTSPAKAGHTAATLRAERARSAGYDLVLAARLLDRSPGEAARDLQRRRPAG